MISLDDELVEEFEDHLPAEDEPEDDLDLGEQHVD